jgi:thioredoxin-like negative regulator of GroEL
MALVPQSRRSLDPFLLLAAAMLGGSTGAAAQSRAEPVEDVPALEARVAADPADVAAAVRLGGAYRDAGRLADARRVLEGVHRRAPQDEGAVLFLGITYEDQGELARARELYAWYERNGASKRLRAELRGRVVLLDRRAREAEVRAAVAQEARLASTPPQPNTVAVFPFLFGGGDEALRPLERALAEFMVTDLSQTGRLRLLERVRVQEMLDEVALADRRRVDPATAARGGRLLRAASVVQGRFAGTEQALSLEARVAHVTPGGARPAGDAVASRGPMQHLFEMEKALAMGVYRELGVELTPAQHERVMHVPTTSLPAVLAFGRGLQAADAGDYGAAAALFGEAARLDPAFAPALRRAQEAMEAARAVATTTAQLADMVDIKLAYGEAVLDAVDERIPGAGVHAAVSRALGLNTVHRRTGQLRRLLGRH